MVGAEFLETGPDRLYSLVIERDQVSLTEAAQMINVGKEIVEAWGEAIEESGLINIRITLMDKYYISPEFFKLSKGRLKDSSVGFIQTPRIDLDRGLKDKERELDERARIITRQVLELNNLSDKNKKIFSDINKGNKELDSKIRSLQKLEVSIDKKNEIISKKEESVKSKLESINEAILKQKNFVQKNKESIIDLKDKKKQLSFQTRMLDKKLIELRKQAKISEKLIEKSKTEKKELNEKIRELERREVNVRRLESGRKLPSFLH